MILITLNNINCIVEDKYKDTFEILDRCICGYKILILPKSISIIEIIKIFIFIIFYFMIIKFYFMIIKFYFMIIKFKRTLPGQHQPWRSEGSYNAEG